MDTDDENTGRRRTCRCPSPYYEGHCLNCSAADVPVERGEWWHVYLGHLVLGHFVRWWHAYLGILLGTVIGYLLAGEML